MKQITLEVQNTKDIQLLMQLAERLHIKAKIKDKETKELTEKELSIAGMKLVPKGSVPTEKSFAKDWEDSILFELSKGNPRINWEKTFRSMASSPKGIYSEKDDKLLDANTPTEFDNKEWEW